MCEPFALEVYRRFLNGESVSGLAEALQVPPERIEQRLRVAALYLHGQARVASRAEASEILVAVGSRSKPD